MAVLALGFGELNQDLGLLLAGTGPGRKLPERLAKSLLGLVQSEVFQFGIPRVSQLFGLGLLPPPPARHLPAKPTAKRKTGLGA